VGLLEPGGDPGLAVRAGEDVIGFASGLVPQHKEAEPLPLPPNPKLTRAGEDVIGFVNELVLQSAAQPPKPEPPKSDPKIARAGEEVMGFASGLVPRYEPAVFDHLGKAVPELSRKLPRLRFWN
jgi:hypothetical protein